MWRLLVVLVATGCVSSTELVCEPGTDHERVCASTKSCDNTHHLCVDPDQLTSCVGASDGSTCTTAGADGLCHDQVCLPAVCGDNYVTGTEYCDGSDLGVAGNCTDHGFYVDAPVACDSTCHYDTTMCSGRCGDSIVDTAHELCDGAPPPLSCIDFGYGAGFLDCNMCGPGVTDCKLFGWGFPHVTDVPMYDLHGVGDNDIYAIGGTDLEHFDGQNWSKVAIPCAAANADYRTVFALAPGDVLVAGAESTNGVVVHVTATSCTKVTTTLSSDLRDMWAQSASEVWLASDAGVLHYDGTQFTVSDAASVKGFTIWASGPSNVFVGGSGFLRNFDGSGWTTVAAVPVGHANSVWGTGASDVYVGGDDGSPTPNAVLYHYNGSGWTQMLPTYPGEIDAVGAANGRVFAIGVDSVLATFALGFDGVSWNDLGISSTAAISSLYAISTGKVFAGAGAASQIFRYEGTTRVDQTTGFEGGYRLFWHSASEIYSIVYSSATGGKVLGYFDGTQWQSDLTSFNPEDIWVDSTGTVFVADSSNGLRQWNGAATWVNLGASFPATRIAGTSASDIWLMTDPGAQALHHWNGASFDAACATCNPSTQLWGLWGASSSSYYAVGDSGTILHWGGSSWDPQPSGTTMTLNAVYGLDDNNVWAVGWSGTVLHYDGATWHDVSIGHPIMLEGVWATSASDVFVVGIQGTEYHYDGTHWAPVLSGTGATLNAITGHGSSVLTIDQASPTLTHTLVRSFDW